MIGLRVLLEIAEDELQRGQTFTCAYNQPSHGFSYLVGCMSHTSAGLLCVPCSRTHFERCATRCALCEGLTGYPRSDAHMIYIKSNHAGRPWLRTIIAKHPMAEREFVVATPLVWIVAVCPDCKEKEEELHA